jgi:FKBP-type peptidyl-prolyl cis-trans isomerase FkpA
MHRRASTRLHERKSMRSIALAAATLLAPMVSFAAPPPAKPAASAKKAPEKKISQNDLLYLVGTSVGHGLSSLHLSHAELQTVEKGIQDQLNGKPRIDIDKVGQQAFRQQITEFQNDRSAKWNNDYLAKEAKQKGVQKLDKGVLYTQVKAGTGKQPTATDRVKVNYRGTLPDGSEFDSSYKRNAPATFPLNQVIPCWTVGVAQMKVGGKAKLVCPPDAAYGKMPRPGIPPNSPLVFDVELLEILPPAPPPAAKPANPKK